MKIKTEKFDEAWKVCSGVIEVGFISLQENTESGQWP
jgi:hypothetical protein